MGCGTLKKEKIYEYLGAKKFKTIVMKAENIKFNIIHKWFPNIDSWYERRCNKEMERLCRKTKDEEKKKAIRFKYNQLKLAFEKENINRQNRNYHLDLENIDLSKQYLLWNRGVHVRGLVISGILTIACGIGMTVLTGGLAVVMGMGCALEAGAMIVNFQCINLQNYNLCRLEKSRANLLKIEERRRKILVERYANIGSVVYEKMTTDVDLSKKTDIIDNVSNIEQLQELRELALAVKQERRMQQKSSVKNKKL